MLTRRHVLGTALAAASTTPFATASRPAEDWKRQYPEIVLAVVPAGNASGVADRKG